MRNPVQKDRPFPQGGTACFRQKDAIRQHCWWSSRTSRWRAWGLACSCLEDDAGANAALVAGAGRALAASRMPVRFIEEEARFAGVRGPWPARVGGAGRCPARSLTRASHSDEEPRCTSCEWIPLPLSRNRAPGTARCLSPLSSGISHHPFPPVQGNVSGAVASREALVTDVTCSRIF